MNYFFLRRFFSLVPIFSLGLFLIAYFYLHAKPLGSGGGEAYDAALKNIAAIPFGALGAWVFVFLPLIPYFFHLLFSVRSPAKPWHVWFFPLSGVLGILFILYHAFLKTQVSTDYEGFVRIFGNPLNGIFYFAGISFLSFHFTQAISHALIQWGVAISASSRAFFRRISWVCFSIFVAVNGLIVLHDTFQDAEGMMSLFDFVRNILWFSL